MDIQKDKTKTAILLGASGLVGGELLRLLLDCPQYGLVRALVRNPLPLTHPKLKQVIVAFDYLEDYAAAFEGDDLFSCLGTTIKKAGSQEAFRQVDLVYPAEAAALARRHHVDRVFVVSSVGADPRSSNFYLRIKGELEEKLKKQDFREVHVFRPSLLMGDRKELRPLEKISIGVASTLSPVLNTVLRGPLEKYRPTSARAVAEAMLRAAIQPTEPVADPLGKSFQVHESLVK